MLTIILAIFLTPYGALVLARGWRWALGMLLLVTGVEAWMLVENAVHPPDGPGAWFAGGAPIGWGAGVVLGALSRGAMAIARACKAPAFVVWAASTTGIAAVAAIVAWFGVISPAIEERTPERACLEARIPVTLGQQQFFLPPGPQFTIDTPDAQQTAYNFQGLRTLCALTLNGARTAPATSIAINLEARSWQRPERDRIFCRSRLAPAWARDLCAQNPPGNVPRDWPRRIELYPQGGGETFDVRAAVAEARRHGAKMQAVEGWTRYSPTDDTPSILLPPASVASLIGVRCSGGICTAFARGPRGLAMTYSVYWESDEPINQLGAAHERAMAIVTGLTF